MGISNIIVTFTGKGAEFVKEWLSFVATKLIMSTTGMVGKTIEFYKNKKSLIIMEYAQLRK